MPHGERQKWSGQSSAENLDHKAAKDNLVVIPMVIIPMHRHMKLYPKISDICIFCFSLWPIDLPLHVLICGEVQYRNCGVGCEIMIVCV